MKHALGSMPPESSPASSRLSFVGAINAAIAAGFVLSAACFFLSLYLPLRQDALIAFLLGGRDALDYLADADRLRLRMVLWYGPTSAIAFFFVRRLTLSYLQSAVLFACNALLVYSVLTRYWLATEDRAVLAKMFSGADLGWALFLSSTALAVLELVPIAVIAVVLAVAFAKRARDAPTAGRWVAAAQMALVAFAGIAPVAYYVVRLGASEDSPEAKGRAKAASFEALCARTRIEIVRKAIDAKGVVFLHPVGAEIGLLKRLQFVEVQLAPGQTRLGMSYLEYSRAGKQPLFIGNDFTGGIGPVPEPRSEYEISRKVLEDRSVLGFQSQEDSIRDRRTGELVARYSYVLEGGNGPRRFCPRGFGGEQFRSHMVFYVFDAMEPDKAAWMEKQLVEFRKTAAK